MTLRLLIINVYRCMVNVAKLTSSYTGRVFVLAVVMYVDDPSLLIWAELLAASNKKLIGQDMWSSTY